MDYDDDGDYQEWYDPRLFDSLDRRRQEEDAIARWVSFDEHTKHEYFGESLAMDKIAHRLFTLSRDDEAAYFDELRQEILETLQKNIMSFDDEQERYDHRDRYNDLQGAL